MTNISKYQKARFDDASAAAHSLAWHALRSLIANCTVSSHAFEIFHSGGNLRRQSSLVFCNHSRRRFCVCYCVHLKALDLFKAGAPVAKKIQSEWRRYCRGFALFHVDSDGEIHFEDYAQTVRGRRELIRGMATSLSASEHDALKMLLGDGAHEGEAAA